MKKITKFLLVILIGCLSAGAVVAYSTFFVKDTFTASAAIYVHKYDIRTFEESYDESEKSAEVCVRACNGDHFMNRVRERLLFLEPAYDIKVNKLLEMVTITKDEDTPVLKVNVTSTNPRLSADIAHAVVDCIECGDLHEIVRDNSEFSVLDMPDDPNEISPNSKNTARNAAIAFFVGVIVSAGLIWFFL